MAECNHLRLRVFENGILKTFAPKRGKGNRRLEKLLSKELRNLYFLSNIVRLINQALWYVGACSMFVTKKERNFLTRCETVSFSRWTLSMEFELRIMGIKPFNAAVFTYPGAEN